ncbi:MAG: hypothetical protein IJJ99_00700 [Oscillospiraceae bacterium]|nr:hypothetical protein [Oscillospiraceae bacterium]
MKTRTATALFIVLLLLAGVCNALQRSQTPFFETLLFCVNFMIYASLLLFWLQSVRARLLPTRARAYVVAAAILMLTYLVIRVFKYRIVGDALTPQRYAVYAYWAPQTLIPTLFLMTCLRIRRGESETKRYPEALLLIPACLLSAMALTNDLHALVYAPRVPLAEFAVQTGKYALRPGFYLIYAWMGLTAAVGIALLIRESGKRPRVLFPLIGLIALWAALVFTTTLVIEHYDLPRPFGVPEIHIFCMLGFFEICIRRRLLPYNENHSAYFSRLKLPVRITDRNLMPVYRTNAPIEATEARLLDALHAPVYLSEDVRLSGMKIRAGYAFWTEDERELHKEQSRLTSANELLSEENDLIAVENQLKEKQAILDAQNRVYDRIAAALYPKQKTIEALLASTAPDAADFSRVLGQCCVLNAWSKRKSNLLLLSEETLPTPNRELFLALQESARSLQCCGIAADAVGEEYASLPLSAIHKLYDAFETVLEAWLPDLRRLTVSLAEDGVRIAAEGDRLPALPETDLSIERKQTEDGTFLTIRLQEGGAGA